MKNSKFAVIGFWLLVPVFGVIVLSKVFHIYLPREIFKWVFVLPIVTVLLSLIGILERYTYKNLGIINLVLCLLFYSPVIYKVSTSYLGDKLHINIWQNKYKHTPLHIAAKRGDLPKIKALLKNYASIDGQTKSGLTPLMMAIKEKGDIQVVKYLIESDADLNIFNESRFTALYYAVSGGHSEITEMLIKSGAEINYNKNIDFDVVRRPALIEVAAKEGHFEIFNHLLAGGADINTDCGKGATLLHVANDIHIVEKLLSEKFDPNSPNANNETPLFFVTDPQIAEKLIESGADVNARSYDRQTPLHKARNASVAQLLIQKGAAVNVKDRKGNTPLHTVYNEAATKVLLDNGADVKAVNEYGKAPNLSRRGK